MNNIDYAPCYRLLPTGRLEPISPRDLDIRYATPILDVCKRLRYEGAPTIELGNTRTSEQFRVQVHVRYTDPDPADAITRDCRFLVGMPISAFYEYIFVEDLPDLLPFLAQLAPIAQASLCAYKEGLEELAEMREIDAASETE